MDTATISEEKLKKESDIPPCPRCSEDGCCIDLEDIPNRIIFRPDKEESSDSMADCLIFYSDETETSGYHPQVKPLNNEVDSDSFEALAVVELKNNIGDPSKIKEQVSGALDFAIDLLNDCGGSKWCLTSFCLVVHNSSRYSKGLDKNG